MLDVCGAPGGKSLHIADLLNGSGHVTVRDLSDYKVQMIEDNIDRSGFSNISAEVWDALELDEELVETMDLVVAICLAPVLESWGRSRISKTG